MASVSMLLCGCMTLDQDREAQRPRLPENHAIAWTPMNRLYRSVVLDYVTGMDQHSYLFGSANQSAFRPMLEHALYETDLLAPPKAPMAARYGLQIEFKDLEGTDIGTDFAARSLAVYRIVDRSTGKTVFEAKVPASFNARYRGLNEQDAATAYVLSVPSTELVAYGAYNQLAIGGDVAKVTRQAAWRAFGYAAIGSSLFGPTVVAVDNLNPLNYAGIANFSGAPSETPVLGARRGVLAEEGIGARKGFERRRQADFMMMGQSLTKFVLALSESERVPFTTIVPCVANAEVDKLREELEQNGLPWQSDDCMAYQRPYDPLGHQYTPYR